MERGGVEHGGIAFISHQEYFDRGSLAGERMFAIVGAIATDERDIIAEKVLPGMKRAKARRKRVSRPKASRSAKLRLVFRSAHRPLAGLSKGNLKKPPLKPHSIGLSGPRNRPVKRSWF